ncbi:MAG: sensor histidine kinase [Candidatus Xenobiia bacterium LiM19]
MGIIMGLLSLKSGVLKDPSAALSIDAARSRVKSMMVLYEKLYQSSDFRMISTKVHLGALIDEIAGTVSGRESLPAIEKHIDDVILDSDILSPLGIILNELLTNAVKHAFDGRDKGVIGVSLSVKGSHVTLTVEDNGTGVPESIDLTDSTGFGLQLVRMLTEQLGGAIRLERSNVSMFIVEFELQ